MEDEPISPKKIETQYFPKVFFPPKFMKTWLNLAGLQRAVILALNDACVFWNHSITCTFIKIYTYVQYLLMLNICKWYVSSSPYCILCKIFKWYFLPDLLWNHTVAINSIEKPGGYPPPPTHTKTHTAFWAILLWQHNTSQTWCRTHIAFHWLAS